MIGFSVSKKGPRGSYAIDPEGTRVTLGFEHKHLGVLLSVARNEGFFNILQRVLYRLFSNRGRNPLIAERLGHFPDDSASIYLQFIGASTLRSWCFASSAAPRVVSFLYCS